ncbi:endonuclease V [Salinirubrum litoreum]|uniref:Endonuclease V n=1 Tax=Salinirubrum litoreum TaxID=1126234 RepID=A0ABD5R9G1_9EURY|nr:endonuclease V [Salinirubrum litoreum]
MEPVRPEFAPDPDLSRDEMEALQHDVADAAEFTDSFDFAPTDVTANHVPPETVTGVNETLSTGGPDAGDDDTESGGIGAASDSERPLIAGVDQAFLDDHAVSAVVLLRGSTVVDRVYAVTELSTPYIPGLLSFREGGPIIDALSAVERDPDLLVFDGSGRIHYRQAGLATHMGVVFDTPSVGVAKNLLCGTPAESVTDRPAGWRTPIHADADVNADPGTVIGHAYQSRQYDTNRTINPLYVSPGHRVSAETTVELVAAVGGKYKLPEPTRLADAYADEVKRDLSE